MRTPRLLASLTGAILLASAAAALAQEHPAANLPVPRTGLTPEERARAIQFAVPSPPTISVFGLAPDASTPRTVISNVQAVGAGKTDRRLAIVTVYQYQGNTAVNRMVDLGSGEILNEERIPNGAAPLAPVEIEYARSLALADERVAKLVAPFHDTATLQYLLTTTADQSSPLFGKRLVNVIIKTPRGYLSGPRILVNLTDARVTVE